MVRIALSAEVELPKIDKNIDHIISIEMEKELKRFSNELADKAATIIEQYSKLKVFNESA